MATSGPNFNARATSSSRPGTSPFPRHAGPNNQTRVLDTQAGRILCIADIRGRLSHLNVLAKENNAKAIIHTGDFGFFEPNSLERINDRTLRHLIMYSPLIPPPLRNQLLAPETAPAQQRQILHESNIQHLSELPQLLSGNLKLQVPVYTVYGACEDVSILEKFRAGVYDIENLHVLDEATTRCIDVGGVKLRLLGLGGALVMHKLFDNGDGQATIAGGQGTMWTTALQIGELVDTAQRVYDASETRLLVTHASLGREGLMAQLALVLKADLTISAGLHFRYASSYNEFSVQADADGFRNKCLLGKKAFDKVWESVKLEVETVIDDQQRILLEKCLSVVERIPPPQPQGQGNVNTEEPAWKNCWNWNLCDAAYGCLVLDVKDGRVSAELKSQGFNFAYRRAVNPSNAGLQSATSPVPVSKPIPAIANDKIPAPASASATSPAVTLSATLPSESQTPAQPLSPISATASKDKLTKGANGTTPAAQEKAEQKKKEKKEKEREKKEKQRVEKEKEKQGQPVEKSAEGAEIAAASAPSPAPTAKSPSGKASGKATPQPRSTAPSPLPTASTDAGKLNTASADGEPLSPGGASGPESSGTGGRATPNTTRHTPQRNPWTLFMKLPAPAVDAEVREFFQTAKDGITKINMPSGHFGRGRVVFVEFGDEEAMKAGLAQHAEVCFEEFYCS
ncbi:hypothetical protein SISSUDRAFT_983006 [Sistotremastrum suecicum HHB10207 ss-3]|uniref:DUF2433 domain-containing protein n=1 Tax=Sistotremastrum suecicum HHB10207 ss-3 TaxID=1314776 RepID=A0A166FIV5_9AGAM|nr:hypothetical protein SISSUDRAFT_983006 [Sistotremastrum suecicum HHB10207 ss-3]